MKTVVVQYPGDGFADLDLPAPQVSGRDLLVAVQAVSVNPLDTKVRAGIQHADTAPDKPRILGWDAAGTVIATGPQVEHFRPGQRVYYAGDITRGGANCEQHLVDERIVGHMPASLDFAQAAALPLTTITAWEALFDRLAISRQGANRGQRLLVIGGAGGVGSIAIQLAVRLAGLEVIATASRPESAQWARQAGAAVVIDHHQEMPAQLKAAGHQKVDFILCLNDTALHWAAMARMIGIGGRICSVVEASGPLNLNLLKRQCASFVWESMFTRSMAQTHDMIEQHRLLNEASRLIDAGQLRTTLTRKLSPINAQNLAQAHALIERGNAIGKLVVSGW